jgi:prepilin-type N-terminal cleavage/methylation domain-containing protein
MHKTRSGFTLLELLVYLAVLPIVMLLLMGIFVSLNGARAKNEVESEVNSNLRFALQEIESDIRSATSITTPATANGGSIGGWLTTTALPSALYYHSSVVNNNYVYVIGGDFNTNPTSTVWFAPINSTGSIGAWSSTTKLPNGIFGHTSVVSNNYVYAIAGQSGANTSTVWFAPINSTGSIGAWSSTTKIPSTLRAHMSIVNNNYVYVIGGYSDVDVAGTSTVWFAPINSTGSLGAWSSTAALPLKDYWGAAAVYNGYAYLIGGIGNGGNPISYYAPINSTGSLGSWLTATSTCVCLWQSAKAVANNGYLYQIGGSQGSSGTSTVFYTSINSTGSLNTWSQTTPLPVGIGDHASIVNNGYVYTLDGSPDNDATATTTVQYAALNGAASALTLVNTSGTTISYCVVSGILFRQTGGAACTASSSAVTANTVTVSASMFTRLENTNSILGKTVVSIQTDLGVSYNGTGPDEQYSEEGITTTALRN